VKSGISELEKWIANAKEEFAGTSWHELNYIRQAVGFLVKLIFFSDKKKFAFFFFSSACINCFVFYAI
jgi:hypothetical protein